jgi:hypothetical protein
MADRDYVSEARRILEEAGFPLDRIEIRPARETAAPAEESNIDRDKVLTMILEVMADRQPRMAKEIARELAQRGMAGITRRDVNSVLAKEGRGKFIYSNEAYTYTLK